MEEVKTDRRASILRATLELVAQHGFHDAPCSLIAERAGVAAGTIYRYFENKELLIFTLYQELEEKINIVLLEGYSDDKPFRERFIHLITNLFRFFITHPQEFKFVEQFHNSPYGVAFRRDRIVNQSNDCGVYSALFQQGLQQQIIKDLPLEVLYDLAFGPIVFVARNHILGFINLDENLIEQIASACWDSLKR